MASAKEINPLANVSADWAQALEPVAARIGDLFEFVAAEDSAGRTTLPDPGRILRAFEKPLSSVKVLIVGQDPYPTVGHACGLAFSVDPAVSPIPRSLKNILTELRADVGVAEPLSYGSGWRTGQSSRNRLGGSHRQGSFGARCPRRSAGRDLVGKAGARTDRDAWLGADHRVGTPEPAVGRPRILRVWPVQPSKRRASTPGR